jgi:transposase
MAVADGHGLPIAVDVASASPHEIKLVHSTLKASFLHESPQRLIGDKAYDSDTLRADLAGDGIELITRQRSNRKVKTQDGRALRRYCRRWKIERLFAWLQNFRRLITRHEHEVLNFLGFVQLGCIVILLRQYL